MKTIYDQHEQEVTLDDLCGLIYQGFGQFAVHDFVKTIENQVSNIEWDTCSGCEIESPFAGRGCLVCGGA